MTRRTTTAAHRRILVIDDNRSIHDVFRKILAHVGNVEESVVAAEAARPHAHFEEAVRHHRSAAAGHFTHGKIAVAAGAWHGDDPAAHAHKSKDAHHRRQRPERERHGGQGHECWRHRLHSHALYGGNFAEMASCRSEHAANFLPLSR